MGLFSIKRKKPSKRKKKIVVKQRAEIREKSDTTNTNGYKTMPVQAPRNNGISFRVKVKKK